MKKNILLLFVITVIIYSCGNKEKKATTVTEKPVVKIDSTLITDSSWGLITKNTDFEALLAIYGTSNVIDKRVCGLECMDSIDVTIIYPESNRQITVNWKDSAYHKTIAILETWFPESGYHTAAGIKIGSPFKDLLQLNGKKITFSGFSWDYGGYINSYNNGTLEKSAIRFQLEQTEDAGTELSGDIELNTDMPEVKKYIDKIQVSHISISLNREEN
jgi:hypothetical protein